nr:uncharacterized protein LOC100204045 [Hydra vulgaris]
MFCFTNVASLLLQVLIVQGNVLQSFQSDEMVVKFPNTIKTYTEKGCTYLDCSHCQGYGVNPSADPRCKYGCNQCMTNPTKMATDEVYKTIKPFVKEYISGKVLGANPEASVQRKTLLTAFIAVLAFAAIGLVFKITYNTFIICRSKHRIISTIPTSLKIVVTNV